MLRSVMLTTTIVVGSMFFGQPSAQAQWGSFSFGSALPTVRAPDHSCGVGIGSHRPPSFYGYSSRYGSYHPGYHAPPRVWHDTSHLDYHAPSFQRHGRHFHYIPGHYHEHRSGHWDYLHGGHDDHHGH